MKMYHCRKLNMIGFDKNDLKDLFKKGTFNNELSKELSRRDISLNDLQNNKVLMKEITDVIVTRGVKNKEDIELFVALDYALTFCPDRSQIYFVLKSGIQPKNLSIKNIDNLKSIIEEKTLTDFAFFFENGLRQFQLKQYKGELDTDEILKFIERKLKEYGNNIGEVNLLIILQGKNISENFQNSNIDFTVLHKQLLSKGYKFTGNILIAYNEQNQQHVINQVFPKLTTSHRKIDEETLNGWLT